MLSRNQFSFLICLSLILGWSATLEASTFVRAGLEDLTAQNESVLIAQVIDAKAYWNAEGTFILTDVRLEVLEVLKGTLSDRNATVTLLGGTVEDLSTVILGGAKLAPGNSYVLFLNSGNLPGAASALTVQHHAQGAFDIRVTNGTLKAISQAREDHLVADETGKKTAPYGLQGIELDRLSEEIRFLVKDQEVTQ